MSARTVGFEPGSDVALLRRRPGETVSLRVFRDGWPRSVRVRLGERPLQTDAELRP